MCSWITDEASDVLRGLSPGTCRGPELQTEAQGPRAQVCAPPLLSHPTTPLATLFAWAAPALPSAGAASGLLFLGTDAP